MKSDSSVESVKWVKSIQLVAHRVEVRSLVHFKRNLYSGGNYNCPCVTFHLLILSLLKRTI